MCGQLHFPNAEISFLFTSNRDIQKYHQQFMNDPTPTDVMTFVDKKNIDIVISLDQAGRQAKPRGISLLHEVILLMGHALLHAKGFDDLTLDKALQMRQQEFELLARIL